MSFISDNAGCVISTLIILVPVLLLVRWFLKKELEEKRINNVAEAKKELLPRILQAYER